MIRIFLLLAILCSTGCVKSLRTHVDQDGNETSFTARCRYDVTDCTRIARKTCGGQYSALARRDYAGDMSGNYSSPLEPDTFRQHVFHEIDFSCD